MVKTRQRPYEYAVAMFEGGIAFLTVVKTKEEGKFVMKENKHEYYKGPSIKNVLNIVCCGDNKVIICCRTQTSIIVLDRKLRQIVSLIDIGVSLAKFHSL